MAGKYRLTTLGCKVNQYESEQVRELLESLGFKPAGSDEHADLAVVNTCTVTSHAAAKSRKALRKSSEGGRTQTFVIGCYATDAPQELTDIDGVTCVIGHREDALAVIRAWASDQKRDNTPQNDAQPISTIRYSIPANGVQVNVAPILTSTISRFSKHTRAFLKVQDGCDAGCTYCIVAKLRRDLKYKPIDVAVDEARRLVANGHREIVVTGIYLGAFGRGTAIRRRFDDTGSPLADLVDALAAVDGLKRLRLSSLEPGDLDEHLLEVMTSHDNCVPHFHLPLQSGSSEILRRMNRQYTADDFEAMIRRVNDRFDRPAISTDIIVGFPGESDEDFEHTLAVAKRSGFCKIHAFPFSPRRGTAAAKWKDRFVHPQTVKTRMERLVQLEKELAESFRQQFVGEKIPVLVETVDPESGMARGRADRYFEVRFKSAGCHPGEVVLVQIEQATAQEVLGVAAQV